MRRPFAGANRRSGFRGIGGSTGGAPPSPQAIGNGATVYLRGTGITESLGYVAAWDSEGTNSGRYSAPSEAARPSAVTQGSLLMGRFDTAATADRIVAEANIALVRPYTVGLVLAIRSFDATNRTVLDLDSGGRCRLFASLSGGINRFLFSDNLSNMSTPTSTPAGEFVSLILRSNTNQAGAAGSSAILLNGVQEATASPLANTAVASAWTLGSLIGGTNPCPLDLVEVAVFNGEHLDNAEVDALNTWHTYVKGRL